MNLKKLFAAEPTPTLTFFTNVVDISKDPLIQPQPAIKFVPQDWKRMPRWSDLEYETLSIRRAKTVKACPSFVDYFSQGVILPAWCDMAFKYNSETDTWAWATGDGLSPYEIDIHPHTQMLDHMDYKHRGEKAQLVFKLISPWFLKTPKGWSTLQLPLFYHADKDWQVIAGVNDTDVHHVLNQQVLYFGSGREVFIQKGEPLVHYIPFQRTKINIETKLATEKDKIDLSTKLNQIHSKATGGYKYMTRSREED